MGNLFLRAVVVVCAIVLVAAVFQSASALSFVTAIVALAIAWYAMWLNNRLVEQVNGLEFDMTAYMTTHMTALEKRMATLRRWIDQHEERMVLVEKQLGMNSNERIPRLQEPKPVDKSTHRGIWIVDGIVTDEPPDRDSYGKR